MTGTTATTARAGDESNPRTPAIRRGRQADSARRRERVIAVLGRAATDGTELSASGIARAAGVDRSFLYRHRDLLDKIHALEATPPAPADTCGPTVTRASLQADLLAAGERAQRLNGRVRQLEKRLSEVLGEKAWQESGLGDPADVDALNQKISHLEQQVIDLRLQLDERDQDLTAARAANRELIAQLNPRQDIGDTPNLVPAQHLSDTLKSFHQPLNSTNTRLQGRVTRGPPEKIPAP